MHLYPTGWPVLACSHGRWAVGLDDRTRGSLSWGRRTGSLWVAGHLHQLQASCHSVCPTGVGSVALEPVLKGPGWLVPLWTHGCTCT